MNRHGSTGLQLTSSALVCALLIGVGAPATASARHHFRPGSAGVGDPWYPMEGNGGYDVEHYALDLTYDPASGRLDGVARITAVATQDLSRFDLDLQQLTVTRVSVGGRAAAFRRDGQELVVTPRRG
jgi:aminopeptidase N